MQNKISAKMLLSVFISTFKIGCVTFGGGLAMIPLIQSEFCEKRKWIPLNDISDITAVAQTLPGIIALNTSVIAAYRVAGSVAAICAGIGCILPSFIILIFVALFYSSFTDNPFVQGALRGVSGTVIALFISALFKLYKQSLTDIFSFIFFLIAAFLALFFPSLNVIFIIIGGAAAGFITYFIILKRRETDPDA